MTLTEKVKEFVGKSKEPELQESVEVEQVIPKEERLEQIDKEIPKWKRLSNFWQDKLDELKKGLEESRALLDSERHDLVRKKQAEGMSNEGLGDIALQHKSRSLDQLEKNIKIADNEQQKALQEVRTLIFERKQVQSSLCQEQLDKQHDEVAKQAAKVVLLAKEILIEYEKLKTLKGGIEKFEPQRCVNMGFDPKLVMSLDAHLKLGELPTKSLESWIEDLEDRAKVLTPRHRKDIDVPLMRDNFVDYHSGFQVQ